MLFCLYVETVFESTFHRINIIWRFIPIIFSALGKKGLFTSRSRSLHQNFLTYMGPRAPKAANLPSASEGPKEAEEEDRYWYHRDHINHNLVPFVYKLMTKLGECASMAAFYHYKYLAKLTNIGNDTYNRAKFCRIGIMTIDFFCANHVDSNDKIPDEDDIASKLKQLLSETLSPYLPVSMKEEARLALDHIESWGAAGPTTCNYRFVGDETVEVYQFFCMPGLGICYRITNFWTHCFLASCFSHYTSIPIFVHKERVYIGKFPAAAGHKVVFAWGLGNPNGVIRVIIDGVQRMRSRRIQQLHRRGV